MSVQAALRLPGYGDVHYGTLIDNPKPATLEKKKVVDARWSGGVLPDQETFDSLLEALTDSPSMFFHRELLSSYPQVSFPTA
jgi:hypothetical protein